jgi:thymidylate synthase (FAD)
MRQERSRRDAPQRPDIRPGEKPGELLVFDHGFVRLDDAMADDLSVVNGARVSFAVRKEQMDERDKGLIRFLMRERHGCYDDATEVLTEEGWKPWGSVVGDERFATRSRGGRLEYQHSLRLLRAEYHGPMIGFSGSTVDQMVTPDHRVVAAPLRSGRARARQFHRPIAARDVLWRAHSHVATATWLGRRSDVLCIGGNWVPARPWLQLVGLFIGAGRGPTEGGVEFVSRERRVIASLHAAVAGAGLAIRADGATFTVPLTGPMRAFFDGCRDDSGHKVIPRRLLDLDGPLLGMLLDGVVTATRRPRAARARASDPVVCAVTSKRLADGIQELALKAGRSASVRPRALVVDTGDRTWHATWQVDLFARSTRALCRTRSDADGEMGVESYNGTIHCATVPNGTLFVRRNGHAVFSGNSPFEHNSFRFHVRTPIFVAREWFRHRVGSFNEESARYHTLASDFYVPTRRAVRTQVGKPGSYSYEPVVEQIADETIATFERLYGQLYSEYEELIDKGVAKELARAILPFGIYTQFYWTLNARSLMNFLSLRNSPNAQFEIRTYAEAVERLFAEKMPATYECFVEFGRRVP